MGRRTRNKMWQRKMEPKNNQAIHKKWLKNNQYKKQKIMDRQVYRIIYKTSIARTINSER
jgi:hypothetical protein